MIKPALPRDWTVLYYANGNCSRDSWLLGAVRALGMVGSDDRVAFTAQYASESSQGAAERLSFGQPDEFTEVKVQVEEKLGVTNMGTPASLNDFLQWGIRRFPARHYMVILAGHGGSFRGCLPDRVHGDHLSHSQVADCLGQAAASLQRPLDVVVEDCCFTSCIEAAQPLSGKVDYLIASQEWGYNNNLSTYQLAENLTRQCADAEVSAEEAARLVLSSMRRPTAQAALHCRDLEALVKGLRELGDALLHSPDSEPRIRQIFAATTSFGEEADLGLHTPLYRQTRDLIELARRLAEDPGLSDNRVQQAAAEVARRAQEVVVARRVDNTRGWLTQAQGLSIYAPVAGAEEYLSEYSQLNFAQASGWDRVVERFGSQS